MEVDPPNTREKVLAKLDSDAYISLKAANAVFSSLKKFRTAAQTGNLRESARAIETANRTVDDWIHIVQ